MDIKPPYLLFLGDVPDDLAAKTAYGIVDWRPDWCVGQMRLSGCQADTGVEDISFEQAKERGVQTMVIGAVNAGGVLPENWINSIIEALNHGFDIASGLHSRLSSIEPIVVAAQKNDCHLHDVRYNTLKFATGNGDKRTGKRLLTVGTDCSVGKKYTALAMEKAMRAKGYNADFRATGQTGVFISGRGVSIDAVIADFISGAVEWISPDSDADHWDMIEGQGSLYHPSYAGVSLGLLHGAQPDAFIVCHEPTRTNMRGVKTSLPSIQQVIDHTINCGQLTNPDIRCVGLSVNTQALDEDAAKHYLQKLSDEYNLPATDPIRFGCDNIVDRVTQDFS